VNVEVAIKKACHGTFRAYRHTHELAT